MANVVEGKCVSPLRLHAQLGKQSNQSFRNLQFSPQSNFRSFFSETLELVCIMQPSKRLAPDGGAQMSDNCSGFDLKFNLHPQRWHETKPAATSTERDGRDGFDGQIGVSKAIEKLFAVN